MPDDSYLQEIQDFSSLEAGSVIRRVVGEKDQQGSYIRATDENDGIIVAEVLDLKAGEFLAEAGIVRPADGDKLYVHKTKFDGGDKANDALEIVQSWTLFKNEPNFQAEILEFVQMAFSPAQLLAWKKEDSLKNLFVPIQQRFKIGRFKEKVDYDKIRLERFRDQMTRLQSGKHMTYVAFIPREGSHKPMFYSIGTKPHLETMKVLEREPYSFRPNHGGHIKCLSEEEGQPKRFLMDAGSNDLGAGMNTSLATAEMVVESLIELYADFEIKPVPGRDAFGIQQSY
ncbi:MAG: hypothetical protein NXI24_09420 [bacterium]|nr:hypothetical protein [bacterium]